jgi:hypothetical protein
MLGGSPGKVTARRRATFSFLMVDVPKLVAAVEALAWKRGCVSGKPVTHRVEADGSHVIQIVVPAVLVDPEKLPKPVGSGKVSMGPSTPDISKPR